MAEKKEQIGTASVRYMGRALFFCVGGGTFTGEGVEGSFAATINGTSIIVYIGGIAYQCSAEDVVNAAVAHFKTLPPEVQAKAKPDTKTQED